MFDSESSEEKGGITIPNRIGYQQKRPKRSSESSSDGDQDYYNDDNIAPSYQQKEEKEIEEKLVHRFKGIRFLGPTKPT